LSFRSRSMCFSRSRGQCSSAKLTRCHIDNYCRNAVVFSGEWLRWPHHKMYRRNYISITVIHPRLDAARRNLPKLSEARCSVPESAEVVRVPWLGVAIVTLVISCDLIRLSVAGRISLALASSFRWLLKGKVTNWFPELEAISVPELGTLSDPKLGIVQTSQNWAQFQRHHPELGLMTSSNSRLKMHKVNPPYARKIVEVFMKIFQNDYTM
jgi:hypothetical protein